MAKILKFRKTKQVAKPLRRETDFEIDELEEDVSAILNDHSLTPANRRWLLENMLMEIDEELEGYKNELAKAEQKLDRLVKSAETDIQKAYAEFSTDVEGMTRAVKLLTRTRRRRVVQELDEDNSPDRQNTP